MLTRAGITRTAITLGVAGSMAGNVTWAWPRSPILVGVGVFMSLVLPVAVRLFKATDGATGWPRVERALVFGFICGGAALYTLVHSTSLLHDLGLPWLIAWVPAAVMEALVVQAARAGTTPVAVESPAELPEIPADPALFVEPPKPQRVAVPPTPVGVSGPLPKPEPLRAAPDLGPSRAERVRQIERDEQVSRSTAYRRLREAAAS